MTDATSLSRRPEYVIEHMEEDDPDAPSVFPEWALLEYRHMLSLVGPGGTVHFTSLSSASLDSLREALSSSGSSSSPRADFELHTASITTLAKQRDIPLSSICLLDPRAPLCLHASDAGKYPSPSNDATPSSQHVTPSGGFTHFLFGGILGDDPPRDRTGSLRALGFPGRHLGKVQMTTDTALGVTKRIVEDGKGMGQSDSPDDGRGSGPSGALEWVEYPDLDFGHGESVSMPFRYMRDDKVTSSTPRPLMPPGMREHIKKDLDRTFEF